MAIRDRSPSEQMQTWNLDLVEVEPNLLFVVDDAAQGDPSRHHNHQYNSQPGSGPLTTSLRPSLGVN